MRMAAEAMALNLETGAATFLPRPGGLPHDVALPRPLDPIRPGLSFRPKSEFRADHPPPFSTGIPMKRVGTGRRASALVALAVLFAACDGGGGTDGPTPTSAVAASATTQTALVGTAVAQAPAVRVTDQDGQAMAGVAVTFVVSAGGGSLASGAATTNTNGVATAGTWTLGTTPGQNTVTATVGSLAPVQFVATAQPPSPATITATSAVTQTALGGTPVPQAPTVRVNDQSGQPLAGVQVTFAVTAGGGSLGTTTATTNASGQATSISWTLGAPGNNTVTATVAGLAPVTFSATAQDPCTVATSYTLFSTVQGQLTTADCLVAEAFFTDFYAVTLPSAQMVEFRMNSTAVDAFLEVYDGQGNFVAGADDVSDDDVNAVVRLFAPAGSYFVGASTSFPEETGAYTFNSANFQGNTGCLEYWVIPGVVISGSVADTDCSFEPGFGDLYGLVLLEGQTLTLSMESTEVDALLELYDFDGNLVDSDDDGGTGENALLSYTATEDNIYIIQATTFDGGDTGAYTLTVTRN
jgi:hypothetical protein